MWARVNFPTSQSPFSTYLFNKSPKPGKVASRKSSRSILSTRVWQKVKPPNIRVYRPVSSTCTASKLMDHVLCSHTCSHLGSLHILSLFQYCFCSGYSRESQLFLAFHDLALLHKQGLQMDRNSGFFPSFWHVPCHRLLNKAVSSLRRW